MYLHISGVFNNSSMSTFVSHIACSIMLYCTNNIYQGLWYFEEIWQKKTHNSFCEATVISDMWLPLLMMSYKPWNAIPFMAAKELAVLVNGSLSHKEPLIVANSSQLQ